MLSPGEKLSHYLIVGSIGAGGMGEVYLAEDTMLERHVALKILLPDVAADEDRVRRFVREAKAASALNHPNILTVYEIGTYEERQYISTELIKGETLRDRLRGEPLSLREVLDIAMQVAAALNAAHEAGIVHRDVKPENIMIRDDHFVKVLDFGLAKLSEPDGVEERPVDSEDATRAQVKTRPGLVMGTVAYMSPEQSRGKQVDARSDIWSLAVVIYEMLSGHTPFAAETASDSIAAILTQDPTPLDENIPAELQRIIRKSLQKNVDERYQTIKDLLLDIKNLKRELEFSEELERSHIPNSTRSSNVATGQAGDATRNSAATLEGSGAGTATNSNDPHHLSSAEYLVSEIKGHKRGAAAVLIVLIALIAAAGYWFMRPNTVAAKQIESIAVMPFVNTGGDPEMEYLSDGVTDSLINNLSQLSNLTVKARSSVFRYKGQDIDVAKVASELKVQAVLNGRVSHLGDNLTFSLELVDALTGNQIWGEQYTRKTGDLAALQAEIARDVAQKLRARLTGAEANRVVKNQTQNAAAYDLYLKGLFYWNRRTQDNMKIAIAFFDQAVHSDPNYTLAYAGLADAWFTSAWYRWEKPIPAYDRAKTAAGKALEIDNRSAEAHAASALVKWGFDWDWAGADREFKQAIELNPSYASAHHRYSLFLPIVGRMDEAVAEAKKALELDPLSLIINENLGDVLGMARRYDEAEAQLLKTIQMDPSFKVPLGTLEDVYAAAGKDDKWLEVVISREAPEDAAGIRKIYAAQGRKGLIRFRLNDMLEKSKTKYVSPYRIAMMYGALGENDKAFSWFDKAFDDRSVNFTYLVTDPMQETLRADPRYQAFLHRAGL